MVSARRLLILGGSGFLGAHVARAAERAGTFEVVIASREPVLPQGTGLENVRIVRHDAIDVLRLMIAPASLAAVHVWFPDPWPKKRHHKRRLIQPAFAGLVASRLAPGGYVHCATDWLPYAEQMLEVLSATPALANRSPAGGYVERPGWRPLTKFEARGLQLGYGVRDLVFERRSEP